MRSMIAATAIAVACVCTAAPARAQEMVYDPYEGMNRHLFAAHEAIDKAVLEPVARGYRRIAPRPVRSGVDNFLHNLTSPVILVNDLLQGEVRRAGVTVARFGVNSTVGVFGVFDPARDMGLERHDEDFGQTLAVWGVPSGPYLFIPVLGPTNLRDGAGRIVDIVIDPLNWNDFDGDDTVRVTRAVATGVSGREELLDEVADLRATSLDPYTTIRSSYGLLRYSAIQNGHGGAPALPTFEEIPQDETPPPTPETPQGQPGQQQQQPTTPGEHPAQADGMVQSVSASGVLQ